MLKQSPNLKTLKARHVSQVRVAKQLIETAAHGIILAQFKSAAAELLASGTAQRAAIFKPSQWHLKVKQELGPAIARVMLIGAARELVRHTILKPKKSSASDYLARLAIDLDALSGGVASGLLGFATEFPQAMLDIIQATLFDSFKRPYWDHISGTTANQLEGILKRGTSEGQSIRNMAHEIEQQGATFSRHRAVTIARTESSRALNNGHLDGIQFVEADTGELLGKTWLSIQGSTTRATHAAADGQTVPSDQPFYVGGHPCMFPGDADLPPEESINCQCTLISG